MADLPMVEALRRHAADHPDAPALTIGADHLTFAQLGESTDRLARCLQKHGVGYGDRIALVLPNSKTFVELVVAALKIGATALPISHGLPPSEQQAIVELANPKLVVDIQGDSTDGRLGVDALIDVGSATDREPLPLRVSPAWRATTSGGSSGRPKLILGTAPAIIDDAAAPDYLLPTRSVVLIPGPLYHTAPFAISLLALVHGNHVILEERFDAKLTLELIERHRPEYLLLVPTMMHRIWRLPSEVRDAADMSCLKTVFHMASHCSPWLKRAWIGWVGAERIYELYGASDSPGNTVIRGTEWLEHPGSVGKPHPDQVVITDDIGTPKPPFEVGEIWMRPPSGQPTRSRLLGAQPRERDGWTSVGDLGWLDADGYLYISDRRSDLIVTGGENVYPAEVEAALEAHPQVRSCVVVGLSDDDLGQRVHAIVEADGISEEDLRTHMAGHLARYKTPRTYELVDRPIRDDAGKIRKSSLIADRSVPVDRSAGGNAR